MNVPDKEWMRHVKRKRHLPEYIQGVDSFLDFVARSGRTTNIPCPCVKCANVEYMDIAHVRRHLIVHGIQSNYKFWNYHGEKRIRNNENNVGTSHTNPEQDHDYHVQSNDSRKEVPTNQEEVRNIGDTSTDHQPRENAQTFYNVLNDSNSSPLYEGSKISKSSALLKLLHLKTVGQWSNESFTMLLKLLNEEILPENSNIPESYYKGKIDSFPQSFLESSRSGNPPTDDEDDDDDDKDDDDKDEEDEY